MKTVFASFALLLLAPLGCSTPSDTATTTIEVPDETTFAPVAAALVYRCGSLDCHGGTYRNFRLYGYDGLRLDQDSAVNGGSTTDAEVQADFEALIGLEPTILSEVVADHGADPSRLTLYRKATGQEDHKGGQRITIGDDADLCLTGWLAGMPNTAACFRVPTEP